MLSINRVVSGTGSGSDGEGTLDHDWLVVTKERERTGGGSSFAKVSLSSSVSCFGETSLLVVKRLEVATHTGNCR